MFDRTEVDFCGYLVPRDEVQFLEAMWKKYENFISYFKLGVFVGGAMLTLLCCVLAQMRSTNLDDVTEAKILEWKSVVQELMKEGFHLYFILDHFPRLLETYLAKRIVAGVTAEAADDVLAKAEIVENASNLQEIPVVNDVTALGMIPKQDSHHGRGSGCR